VGITLTVSEREGSYVTRGRATALQNQIEELARLVDERLGAMEERIDEALAFEHELLRRRIAVELEFVRSFQATARRRP